MANRREMIERMAKQQQLRKQAASAKPAPAARPASGPKPSRPVRPERLTRPERAQTFLDDDHPEDTEQPESEQTIEKEKPKKGKIMLAKIGIAVLMLAIGTGLTVFATTVTNIIRENIAASAEGYEQEPPPENSPAEYYAPDEEDYEYDWSPVPADTWPVWMEITPDTYELDYFFSGLDDNISVFYKNLDTGFTYVHNPYRIYFAASLSKANHAMYVYFLAERGLTDMNAVHTFTSADIVGGTGVMQFEPFGTQFTTRELLGLSIRESDNTAYRMLINLHNHMRFTFQDFADEIGADLDVILNVISQNTHARDVGLWMYAIFNYLERESQYGHYFKYDLLNTAQTSHPYFTRWESSFGTGGEVNISMIQSDHPVARKYGWARNAFHDAAIVYAPSPYILVILSNMERGAHALFEDISWRMQEFNDYWFNPHS